MRRLTRFERKILGVTAAVSIVPVAVALLFGGKALREAYRLGVNRETVRELEAGLEARRAALISTRAEAERAADALCHDVRIERWITEGRTQETAHLLEDALVRHPTLARIAVSNAGPPPFAVASRANRLKDARLRTETCTLATSRGRYRLTLVAATPASRFRDYARAGEFARDLAHLERSARTVSGLYWSVYLFLLLAAIAIALLFAAGLARGMTRHITRLVAATRRVGAGDLAVRVPPGSPDEIGELIQAFNQMVCDLRESHERITYLQRIGAWQEFARRLAHEIKNPLTPIQLAIQEIERSCPQDEPLFARKVAEARSIIEEEVATLRRLVGDFSAFAKLPEVRLTACNLADVLREAARSEPALREDLGEAAQRDRLTVHWVGLEHEVPVQADPMMLKRALDNLLRNALQAALAAHPEGGGEVRVSLGRTKGDAWVEITDNGPGVANADWNHLFQPYFTTKPEGTGLGLPIVKKIVLEHGGTIEGRCTREGGAIFRLTFPIAR